MGVAICFANHKGGCGKTSLVVNTADALQREGFSVLVIDFDPQANSTKHLLGPEAIPPANSVMDALLHDNADISRFIQPKTRIKNVSVLGATIKLMRVEEKLREGTLVPARVFVPKMRVLREMFDVILIDTPPNLFMMPTIALCSSDFYFVPIQSGDPYSLDGVDDLTNLVRQVDEINPGLQLGGAIITRHDGRKRVARATIAAAHVMFDDKVLSTTISDSALVQQAAATAVTVMELKRDSAPSIDFANLAKEIIAIAHLKKDDHGEA